MITLLSGLVLLSASSLAEAATHVVKAGDNMFRISLRYGISLSQLQAANPGVHPQSLRVGQKLTIPANAKNVAAAESVEEAPEPSSPTPTRISDDQAYTVQAGDNLSKIARMHGTTVSALQAANPNLKANQVAVGQRIALPKSKVPSESSPRTEITKTSPEPTPEPSTPPTSTTAPALAKKQPEQTPLAPATSNNEPAAAAESKPVATAENAMPKNTTTVGQETPTSTGEKIPSYRLIKTTRELTLEQVAAEYHTTPDKINSLNGWSFSPQTLLAVDSELYIPAKP